MIKTRPQIRPLFGKDSDHTASLAAEAALSFA